MTQVHSTNTTRRAALGTGAALALVGLSGCLSYFSVDGGAEESTEESIPGVAVQRVEVSNTIGRVTIAADDIPDVVVRITKRASDQARFDDIVTSTTLTEGLLRVSSRLVDDASYVLDAKSPTTDVTITVPAGSVGPVISRVESDLGDVTLTGTRGDTVVTTDLGKIFATDVDGYLSLRSDLGDIEAAGVNGLDNVQTDLGTIKVDLLGLRGDVDIGAEMGNVVVGVADDLDLDVLAEALDVSSDLVLSAASSDRKNVSGRLNRGGSRLHVFSEMGNVDLRTIQRRR